MKIGSLFQFKKEFWLLYPSKKIAVAVDGGARRTVYGAEVYAAYWSKHLKCNVSYIEPNSIFVLLEQDGKYIKVLSTNGEVGWIILADWYKDDIEEA